MKFAILRSLSGKHSNKMKLSKNAGATQKTMELRKYFFCWANAINVPKIQPIDSY
jgi:hypothetical protein